MSSPYPSVSGKQIHVAFYDRHGLDKTATSVTLARSTDGGESFETFPVAIEPFETTDDVFFGDYLGVAAHGGRVVTVFSHFTTPSDRHSPPHYSGSARATTKVSSVWTK